MIASRSALFWGAFVANTIDKGRRRPLNPESLSHLDVLGDDSKGKIEVDTPLMLRLVQFDICGDKTQNLGLDIVRGEGFLIREQKIVDFRIIRPSVLQLRA